MVVDHADVLHEGVHTRRYVVVERLKVDETIDAWELDEILASAVGPTVWDPESAPVTHA